MNRTEFILSRVVFKTTAKINNISIHIFSVDGQKRYLLVQIEGEFVKAWDARSHRLTIPLPEQMIDILRLALFPYA